MLVKSSSFSRKCRYSDYRDNLCKTHYKKKERGELKKLLCTNKDVLVFLYDIDDKRDYIHNHIQKIDSILSRSKYTLEYYNTCIYKGVFVMHKEKLEILENDRIFNAMFNYSNLIMNNFNKNSEKYKIKSVWKYMGDINDDSEYFFVISYK